MLVQCKCAYAVYIYIHGGAGGWGAGCWLWWWSSLTLFHLCHSIPPAPLITPSRYNAFISLLVPSFHPFLFLASITILESARSMETHIRGGRHPAASTVKAKKELEGEDEDDEMVDEEEEEEEEENEEESEECHLKRKKMDLGSVGLGKKGSSAAVSGGGGGGGGVTPSCCQVEQCGADLTFAKTYHKRHKVCEVHAKAPAVLLNGVDQRFCQQCSRFHEVSEFDEAKRSCRRRLAGHNERRRKASSENRGEGSSRRRVEPPLKESKQQCNQIDGRGGNQLIISGTSSYKNFHIH